jgi:hypothetical protein
MASSPLVLLDVDGVLNPLERPHDGFRRVRCSPNGITYFLWLNPSHGRMLTALAESADAELAWASYWCDHANDWIAPRIGLPTLPFVPIPGFPGIEDEPDVADRLAAEPAMGEHLLVAVDPLVGLTEEHIEQARDWLQALSR